MKIQMNNKRYQSHIRAQVDPQVIQKHQQQYIG